MPIGAGIPDMVSLFLYKASLWFFILTEPNLSRMSRDDSVQESFFFSFCFFHQADTEMTIIKLVRKFINRSS